MTIKIIDITHKLNGEIYIYEGDPHVHIEQWTSVEGNGYAITKLQMGSHSGSHIDAPAHVFAGGKKVDEIPLSQLVGSCAVVEKCDLQNNLSTKRIIIRGKDEQDGRIDEATAHKIVESGIRVIGTNSLSIGSDEVHDILLADNCVILEYLNLTHAVAGNYFLCALPLKIAADGSPLRACLIDNIDLENE